MTNVNELLKYLVVLLFSITNRRFHLKVYLTCGIFFLRDSIQSIDYPSVNSVYTECMHIFGVLKPLFTFLLIDLLRNVIIFVSCHAALAF